MVKQISSPIIVNFENIDHSEATVDYINKRIHKPKFTNLDVRFGEVNIKKDHEGGVDKYTISFDLTVKGRAMYFKETGDEIFSMIDTINDKMKIRLSKLKNTRNYQTYSETKLMY